MIHIQVIGAGCPKCAKLARRVADAAQRLGVSCRLEKVTGLREIVTAGIPVPALVIGGVVKTAGLVPTVTEIQEIVRDCLADAASAVPEEPLPAHGLLVLPTLSEARDPLHEQSRYPGDGQPAGSCA